MKMASVTVAALATFLLSAGVAAAQMQPIPNPPEKPHMMHHGHHHMMRHHHHHHHHHHKMMEKKDK